MDSNLQHAAVKSAAQSLRERLAKFYTRDRTYRLRSGDTLQLVSPAQGRYLNLVLAERNKEMDAWEIAGSREREDEDFSLYTSSDGDYELTGAAATVAHGQVRAAFRACCPDFETADDDLLDDIIHGEGGVAGGFAQALNNLCGNPPPEPGEESDPFSSPGN